MWRKLIKKNRQNRQKSICKFSEEIQGLSAPHCAQNRRKKCKSKVKLNDYWTNLHKN